MYITGRLCRHSGMCSWHCQGVQITEYKTHSKRAFYQMPLKCATLYWEIVSAFFVVNTSIEQILNTIIQ